MVVFSRSYSNVSWAITSEFVLDFTSCVNGWNKFVPFSYDPIMVRKMDNVLKVHGYSYLLI